MTIKTPNYEDMYWRTTKAHLRLVNSLKDLQRQAVQNPGMNLKTALDKLLLDEMMTDDYDIGREE